MGLTTRWRGVYGGEFSPVCVVEEEQIKEASESGQRFREN
jgi:hypothetical protein